MLPSYSHCAAAVSVAAAAEGTCVAELPTNEVEVASEGAAAGMEMELLLPTGLSAADWSAVATTLETQKGEMERSRAAVARRRRIGPIECTRY